MKYEPHNYQTFAIDYIVTHPIAAVLLDMGLGKTSITLTAILDLLFDSFVAHRVLVIAPLRVARDTWPAEIQKWDHLSLLTYTVAVGNEAERKAALLQQTDICIINRENVQWLIEDIGLPFDFDTVVVDELSSFKSYQAKRFRALMKVRPKVKRIVGLTGTPSANGLMDLWAEYRLLDMGQRLGRFIGQYRTNYFMPDKRNGQIIYSYKPLPGAEAEIYRRISDITISMKSTDHLKMPELISTECEVRLSDEEQKRYDDLKEDLVLQLPGGDITAANAASLSGKLCQMANGAVYSDTGGVIHIHDRKLDALEDQIEAANGKPVSDICKARDIPEKILIKVACDVLNIPVLDPDVFGRQVKEIHVPAHHVLDFIMTDGSKITKTWNPDLQGIREKGLPNQDSLPPLPIPSVIPAVGSKLTEGEKRRIVELRSMGYEYSRIAASLGRPVSTIRTFYIYRPKWIVEGKMKEPLPQLSGPAKIPAHRSRITDEDKTRISELRAQGYGYVRIAHSLGRPVGTIRNLFVR